MPHGDLHGKVIDFGSFLFGREELLDEFHIGWFVVVKFARLHILHLRMILQFLNLDVVATNEKHSLDLEVGLLAEHGKPTESEAPEAFQPLDEAHQ